MAIQLDPNFKPIPVSQAIKSPAVIANAASQGMTPAQYVESRGGVNASGYYGDSYGINSADKVSLTDAEYAAAVASASGKPSGAAGAAVNAALAAKIKKTTGTDPAWLQSAMSSAAANKVPFSVTGSTNATTLGGNYAGSGTAKDPFSLNGVPYTGTVFGSTYKDGVIVDTAAKTAADIAAQGRLDARVEFANTLKGLGLPQDLIDEVDNMIKQDYTKSQMYLELQKTDAWNKRFPGMAALAAAGKAVDAGTYISMEKGFLQTLSYYGLDKNIFGTTAELGKYISNLTSPAEFEARVSLAADRVEKNPDVLAELNLYYGVDKSAAITYLLNPAIGMDIIKRQARAAEIGAAAAKSKFDFGNMQEGYGVAESFINAAGTEDFNALQQDFQQARQLADTQSRLAQIEGSQYADLQAVTAILGKDQAEMLQSQKRAAREQARFGGSAGLSASSLKTESQI